jgi:hypothetical protein
MACPLFRASFGGRAQGPRPPGGSASAFLKRSSGGRAGDEWGGKRFPNDSITRSVAQCNIFSKKLRNAIDKSKKWVYDNTIEVAQRNENSFSACAEQSRRKPVNAGAAFAR